MKFCHGSYAMVFEFAANAFALPLLSFVRYAVNTSPIEITRSNIIAAQAAMIHAKELKNMVRKKKVVEIEQPALIESSNNEPTHIEPPIMKEETKMFFTYDEKEAGGFEMLPAGEYEVIVSETEVKESASGNPMIKAVLTIRTDVEQEGGKRKIFDNFIAMQSTMFKFHQMAKALGWGQGEGAADLEDFANKILYQQVKVKLKQGKAQNGYEAKNEVVTYLPSDYITGDNGVGGAADPYALDDGKPIDISDDDLPF